ncbi:hypothetical protein M427DRAFT_51482 [Gonapodya prolifera JEL478]|uniref:ubiquitinyl hydrolase 1 n=1 Tax=Gonapodya prolifera (strain JEL478) TaxID=1344416 RepID=A0A139AWY4_GONPJ|nr:hypothetical protein M427DRAFT_51482 [Gonapodya prolifera JEL478]|eukprot:KXS21228.1 hypothetical protein M427DRAFT_51482 [Gonapodya prolifera JEL478]
MASASQEPSSVSPESPPSQPNGSAPQDSSGSVASIPPRQVQLQGGVTVPYHEQQFFYCCAMHAVNCALQKRVYYKRDFDRVAERLHKETRRVQPFPWNVVNPHKSLLGVGNYDVNVISRSLEEHGFELQWWDLRKSFTLVPFSSASFLALLINTASADLLSSHHFWTIREYPRHSNTWWTLDSKQEKPDRIGDLDALLGMLNMLKAAKRELQVMVVVAKQKEDVPTSGPADGANVSSSQEVEADAEERERSAKLEKQHPMPYEIAMERRGSGYAAVFATQGKG